MEAAQVLGGRYRLECRLGEGGMSVVWRARDEVLGRSVAVKVLAGPFAADAQSRKRIRTEAQAVARLSHPHVTSVYDYGESPEEGGESLPYIVMELLPGLTLAERLADGPLRPMAALRVCAEVAGALAAAHDEDIVHRDVKPANVILTPSGAKVLDFGIAAIAGQGEDADPDSPVFGTPAYLAPERLTGDEVVSASDVYALGLLIYRVLTDRLPWEVETTTQMLTAHVYVEPTPLPPLDGVPPQVAEVCWRCLAKDPDDRPPAREVAAVLAAAAGLRFRAEDDEEAFVAEGSAAEASAAATSAVLRSEPPAGTNDLDTDFDVGQIAGGERRRRALLVLAGAVAAAALLLAIAFAMPGEGADHQSVDAAGGISAGNVAPGGGASRSGQLAPPVVASASTGPGDGGKLVASGATGRTLAGGQGGGPVDLSPTPVPTPVTDSGPRTLSSAGGDVVAQCRASQAVVLDVVPASGFVVKKAERGPANQLQVVFRGDKQVKMKIRCVNGLPTAQNQNN